MPASGPYETHDVKHFERWSRTYEGSRMQRRLFDPVHQAVLDFAAPLPAPASVLDVGCGTGRLLRAVASRWPYAQLIGVDPAQGMVEVARTLTPGATIQRGLAEALPLPDASVDLAVSTLSFHHWADQTAGVREIARVLRPGGHFILADFAPPNWLARLRMTGRALPRADRQRVFEAADLRVERQRDIAYPFILGTLAVR